MRGDLASYRAMPMNSILPGKFARCMDGVARPQRKEARKSTEDNHSLHLQKVSQYALIAGWSRASGGRVCMDCASR